MKKEITKDEVIKNTLEKIEHLLRLNVPIEITINHDGGKSVKTEVRLSHKFIKILSKIKIENFKT